MKRGDRNRYQTCMPRGRFGGRPTAGLHFTKQLLDELSASGIDLLSSLSVGLGTFRPVKAEEIEEHVMHREIYRISEATAEEINETKRAAAVSLP